MSIWYEIQETLIVITWCVRHWGSPWSEWYRLLQNPCNTVWELRTQGLLHIEWSELCAFEGTEL